MDTAPLKSFATKARTDLLKEVSARVAVVLAPNSQARIESAAVVRALEDAITRETMEQVIDRVAYTWFNRIIALRFMDANGYTASGIVSPSAGQTTGQPEVLAEAKANVFDGIVPVKTQQTITALFNGTRPSRDRDGEAYGLLLEAYCRNWHKSMPFMFEQAGDYTELLIPTALLAQDSIRDRAVKVLTPDVCSEVEVIGWLYQFYISERKDEVFEGFKKNKKAGAAEIPAATQLFTPHWIVRYLVENSLGRLWLLNNPSSKLADQMDYYINPVDEETDFLKVSKPEELKIIDPAVGSGHMLTYAFDLLYAIYQERGYDPSEIPGLILKHNLYGTEIDPRAGALAAFALTMKAAAKRKLFLKNPVQPNVRVLENVVFDQSELDYLWSLAKGGSYVRGDADEFWNAFEHASTFGSLIQPKEHLVPPLRVAVADAVRQAGVAGDALAIATLTKAQSVLVQAEYLSQRYSVVVANPPYMGSRNMVPMLAQHGIRHFRPGKADLFAMFIMRSLDLLTRYGTAGMITMQGWMFLPSFEALRQQIVESHRITALAHLGSRAFDSINGEVVSTVAFLLRKAGNVTERGDYFRLVGPSGEAAKSALFRAALTGPGTATRFAVAQTAFDAVPGYPIAYWADDKTLALFADNQSVGAVSQVRAGMATGDNDRFLRLWHEVSARRLKLNAKSVEEVWANPDFKWVIFNKGGDTRRWYGHLDYVLAYDRASHAILKESGNKCPSEEFYFRECLTWSDVTSGPFAVRYMPAGSVLSTVGNSIYEGSFALTELACALNSGPISRLLPLLNPTLHANPGDVARLPIPAAGSDNAFGRAVDLSRTDWHSLETSWGFSRPSFLPETVGHSERTRDVFAASDCAWSNSVRELAEIERDNELLQRTAYKLTAEPADVRSDLDAVTLTRNYFTSRVWDSAAADRDRTLELVSYAVGCMFGRYSLDQPGLILADQGSTLEDYLAQVPSPSFMPDQDNVIPIVDGEWFEDDIVTRFRAFLRAAFGDEHFEENLHFVEQSLGVKDIRDYFVKSFYDDHVKRYKKRPIYWLFRSPKGGFSALIYLHRYQPSTASTVLTGYLREFIGKLEANLQHQRQVAVGLGGASARDQALAAKEADRIQKVLVELADYEHNVLFPLAGKQLALDLDDGVLVNYQKLGAALKDIGLKKGGGD
ncbi:MAG: BREX-1 system adenine-specific DNA-methyltransferase PglX [Cryobacterium sp.]|nr:BREX-1 system adenine-specific DNA-methyltransferase PglX [Cryobacterium sp.]